MLKEFKAFAFKGNLVDMAVGIIIGGAFSTVVKSLVDDVIMPVIGSITPGDLDFSERFAVLKAPEGIEAAAWTTSEEARAAGATVLTWGNFLTAVISFLIVAWVLFIVVKKFMTALLTKKDEPALDDQGPPPPSAQEKLLSEIRDILLEDRRLRSETRSGAGEG